MSNPLALANFTFEDCSIRVYGDFIKPLFVAADVCKALHLSNPTESLKALAPFEKTTVKVIQQNPNNDPKLNLGSIEKVVNAVTESGLFTLILRCRDAIKEGTFAYRFRLWVTSEVLPAIRKQGAYVSDKLTYEEALKIVESRNATLTPAQQYAIKSAVAARAQKEPAKYKEIYSALKRRFQVARYDQIMKEDYEEALTFIREMQLTAQLPARPKQNEAEPVVVNDQEIRYELGMTRAEIESFGQFIYCWKYLFRPSLVTFRELLSAVHSPLAGNLYDATFDTTLNRVEEVFRKHGIPVGPEHLSKTLPFYP
ncbi:BRO family protein [uncultured Parasutterella sp.]|uniref:BRO family protein n=1 Tax=uncultured Parasutterella sp. TaxID=1263098 RepID=UPI0025B4F985|nr:BRO family protein [uncultured Parasutterella sp.]